MLEKCETQYKQHTGHAFSTKEHKCTIAKTEKWLIQSLNTSASENNALLQQMAL